MKLEFVQNDENAAGQHLTAWNDGQGTEWVSLGLKQLGDGFRTEAWYDEEFDGEATKVALSGKFGEGTKFLVIDGQVMVVKGELEVYEVEEEVVGEEEVKRERGRPRKRLRLEGCEVVDVMGNGDAEAMDVGDGEGGDDYVATHSNRENGIAPAKSLPKPIQPVRVPQHLNPVPPPIIIEETPATPPPIVEEPEETYLLNEQSDIFAGLPREDVMYEFADDKMQNTPPVVPVSVMFMCFICRQVFPTRLKLEEHKKDFTPTRLERVCCEENCGMKFDNANFHEHVLTEHHDRRVCPKCLMILPTPESAAEHCKTKKGLATCPKCTKSSTNLAKHLMTEPICFHIVVGRSCEVCMQDFDDRKELLRHERNRRSDGQAACCLCAKVKPVNWTVLRNHMRLAHDVTTVFHGTCEKCNTVFDKEKDYRYHVQNHDELTCKVCAYTYK